MVCLRCIHYRILQRASGVFVSAFLLGAEVTVLSALILSVTGTAGHFALGLYRSSGLFQETALWLVLTYLILRLEPVAWIGIGAGSLFLAKMFRSV